MLVWQQSANWASSLAHFKTAIAIIVLMAFGLIPNRFKCSLNTKTGGQARFLNAAIQGNLVM